MDIVFDGDSRVFQKCLGCGQYESDNLRIVGYLTGTQNVLRNLEDVFVTRLGMTVPEELSEELEAEEAASHIKRALLTAAQSTLAAGITQSGGEFAYVQDTVNLLRHRNIDLSMLYAYGLGVFPTLKHFSDFGDINMISEINEYLGPRVFDV
jgi:hypothetical protein